MLVLSRKNGEEIKIGDDITIKLLHKGGRTRIGIDAPRSVPIVRGELIETEATEGNRDTINERNQIAS